MKIALTGATGFVGEQLAIELIRQGHQLNIFTRNAIKARQTLPFPADVFQWDPLTETAPTDGLKGCDAVIHLAGDPVAEGRWTDEKKKRILESRTLGTRNLVHSLKQLSELDRPKALISASAIGYYGDRKNEKLIETSKVADTFLADVCFQWEKEALAAEKLNIRVASIRIGIVLGHSGGALLQMLPIFRSGLGGPLGDGKQYMSWIHLQDLVNLFIFAVKDSRVSGPINGSAPHPVTNQEFTKTLGKTIKQPTFFATPSIALQLALGESAAVILSSQRVYPEKAQALGFQFQFSELAEALQDLLFVNEASEKNTEILERRQFIQKPIEEVFPFFSDAKNLEKLTPDCLNFKILTQSTDSIKKGTLIDYQIKIRGIPVKWRTLIEVWEPGKKFVDRQLKGPYQLWHHTHLFEKLGNGTLMTDRVLYKLPVGILGRLIGASFVKKDVETIFDYRFKMVQDIFKSE